MWIDSIEKNKSLLELYKGDVPDAENIILREVKITTGEDLCINIRFDLKDLPKAIPQKWLMNQVNAVQLTLDLIQAKIEYLHSDNLKAGSYSLTIEQLDDYKRLTLINTTKGKSLVIKASWIYLNSLLGYREED